MRIIVLSAIIVLTACSSTPRSSTASGKPPQLVSWDLNREQRCATSPFSVPAPADFLDMQIISDSLEGPRYQSLRGSAVFSIVYDKSGLVRSDIIQTTLPDSLRLSLRDVIAAALPREYERPHIESTHWGWQLRMDLADGPQFVVGRQEVCPPRMRGEYPAVQHAMHPEGFAGGSSYSEHDRVLVRLHIDEEGYAKANVARGSRTGRFDAVAASAAAANRYWPLLIDRIPTATELVIFFP